MKALLIAASLLLFATPLWAETIRLKSGRVIQADSVTTQDKTLIVHIKKGEIELDWSELAEADGRKYFPSIYAEMDQKRERERQEEEEARRAAEEAMRVRMEKAAKEDAAAEKAERVGREQAEAAAAEKERLQKEQAAAERKAKEEAEKQIKLEMQQKWDDDERKWAAEFPQKREALDQVKTKISGGAWIAKKSGNSDILRGLDIFFCDGRFEHEYHRTAGKYLEANLEISKRDDSKFLSLFSLYRLIGAKMLASKHVLQHVTTDVEGKFEAEITGSAECLFAYHATDYSVVIWVIPITVKKGEPLKVNFHNDTANTIENKPDK